MVSAAWVCVCWRVAVYIVSRLKHGQCSLSVCLLEGCSIYSITTQEWSMQPECVFVGGLQYIQYHDSVMVSAAWVCVCWRVAVYTVSRLKHGQCSLSVCLLEGCSMYSITTQAWSVQPECVFVGGLQYIQYHDSSMVSAAWVRVCWMVAVYTVSRLKHGQCSLSVCLLEGCSIYSITTQAWSVQPECVFVGGLQYIQYHDSSMVSAACVCVCWRVAVYTVSRHKHGQCSLSVCLLEGCSIYSITTQSWSVQPECVFVGGLQYIQYHDSSMVSAAWVCVCWRVAVYTVSRLKHGLCSLCVCLLEGCSIYSITTQAWSVQPECVFVGWLLYIQYHDSSMVSAAWVCVCWRVAVYTVSRLKHGQCSLSVCLLEGCSIYSITTQAWSVQPECVFVGGLQYIQYHDSSMVSAACVCVCWRVAVYTVSRHKHGQCSLSVCLLEGCSIYSITTQSWSVQPECVFVGGLQYIQYHDSSMVSAAWVCVCWRVAVYTVSRLKHGQCSLSACLLEGCSIYSITTQAWSVQPECVFVGWLLYIQYHDSSMVSAAWVCVCWRVAVYTVSRLKHGQCSLSACLLDGCSIYSITTQAWSVQPECVFVGGLQYIQYHDSSMVSAAWVCVCWRVAVYTVSRLSHGQCSLSVCLLEGCSIYSITTQAWSVQPAVYTLLKQNKCFVHVEYLFMFINTSINGIHVLIFQIKINLLPFLNTFSLFSHYPLSLPFPHSVFDTPSLPPNPLSLPLI